MQTIYHLMSASRDKFSRRGRIRRQDGDDDMLGHSFNSVVDAISRTCLFGWDCKYICVFDTLRGSFHSQIGV